MTIPDCANLTVSDQSLKVTLPGGAQIPVLVPETNPNDLQVSKALLGQASGAMAPLVPIFNIIDALLAVKAFAEAVPGVITNPSKLATAISDLVKKISKLASLIPQLSVPLMIVDLIDVVLVALAGVINALETIAAQEARIAAAITKSEEPGNEALATVITCAQDLLVKQKAGVSEGLGPLNTFFGLMNVFLELIGLEPIPDLSGPLPDDTQEAIDTMNDLVKLLRDLRATIPI